MKNLHPTQQKLLELLRESITDPLTVRQLQEILEVSSTSVVAHHIKQLEKKGYLKRNPDNPRDYQILSDSPEKLITYLNLYGLAHCGPRGSVLDGNPIERIPIASRLITFPVDEAFMVRATGDSMEPGIHEDDFVIVRKADVVEDGRVVLCINDGEAIIKKFQRQKKQSAGNLSVDRDSNNIILSSVNSKYAPFLAGRDFRIEGEVKSVITNRFA